jgi:uracil DNA glycosylase
LKDQKSRGFVITPEPVNTFRSFQMDLNKLSVVIMGMSPYPQVDKNGYKSNGLAFCCEQYGGMSPSLEKFYEACEDNLDEIFFDKPLSLQYLVDQGVMLTNASLTCTKDSPDVHKELWKPFWKQVFDKIFFARTGLVFILMGNNAQELEEFTNPVGHHILKCEHPVASSYRKDKMRHNNVFTETNKLLIGMQGPLARIEFNYGQVLPF